MWLERQVDLTHIWQELFWASPTLSPTFVLCYKRINATVPAYVASFTIPMSLVVHHCTMLRLPTGLCMDWGGHACHDGGHASLMQRGLAAGDSAWRLMPASAAHQS